MLNASFTLGGNHGNCRISQIAEGPIRFPLQAGLHFLSLNGVNLSTIYWSGGSSRRCLLQILATGSRFWLSVPVRVLFSADDGVLSIQQGRPDGASLQQLGTDD